MKECQVTMPLSMFDEMREKEKGSNDDLAKIGAALKRVFGKDVEWLLNEHNRLAESENRSRIREAIRMGTL